MLGVTVFVDVSSFLIYYFGPMLCEQLREFEHDSLFDHDQIRFK